MKFRSNYKQYCFLGNLVVNISLFLTKNKQKNFSEKTENIHMKVDLEFILDFIINICFQIFRCKFEFQQVRIPARPHTYNVRGERPMGIFLAQSYYGPMNGAIPVSILRKSISGCHRPVRVADGPMTARCRFT